MTPKKPFVCVDLFCGAGGISQGLRNAAKKVGYTAALLAINHWPVAIDSHTLNHPEATHICAPVDGANPRELVPGGIVHLLCAAPECTHHSNARGGKPKSEQKRSSAWDILRWADALYVHHILIENVPEFQKWGPLHPCTCGVEEGAEHLKSCLIGKPIKEEEGRFFRNFIRNLEELGYTVEFKVLTCCEYGDPTSRKRLFIQARLGGIAPAWPEITHVPAAEVASRPGKKAQLVARDIIDWKLKGTSIYDRPAQGKKNLVAATMKRIHAGVYKFAGLPFLVPNFGEREGQQPRTHSIYSPLSAVTSHGAGAICQPFLVVLQNHRDGYSLEKPFPTIMTRRQFGVAEPYIAPITHTGSGNRCRGVDKPLFTVTGAKRGELALLEPYMVVNRKNADAHPMDVPMRALTTGNIMGVAEPQIVTDSVNAFLVKYYEGSDAASLDAPLPAVTSNYEHLALIETVPEWNETMPAFMTKYHGSHQGRNDGDGRVLSVGSPLPALDTSNCLGIAEPNLVIRQHTPFLINYNGTGGAHSVDEPLLSATGNDRFALVAPEYHHLIDKGDVVGYLDILYRMLQPHELAGGQGFPKSYIFTGTREAQIKQIGNAVPVATAEALCTTIFKTLMAVAV
ncbi:DNA methyltransferase [Capsulimonas corticalis]|uniref:DNA methyltransferase n=1 Tax=Capsulimonas corticalis TaxID=2219043 RepID=A0A402D5V3_9BACT|nr:DNA cytosine methyltransferase [Capsulimonas corticalis]BDI33459.1 DNA methyltransferase [Capsulimonas corticalis]